MYVFMLNRAERSACLQAIKWQNSTYFLEELGMFRGLLPPSHLFYVIMFGLCMCQIDKQVNMLNFNMCQIDEELGRIVVSSFYIGLYHCSGLMMTVSTTCSPISAFISIHP